MRTFFLIFLLATIVACSNDDENTTTEDYSLFLKETAPQFKGTINGTPFRWEFNVGTYQMGSSYFFPEGDPTDPKRLLDFTLNQEEGDNQFIITAPIYDTSSESEYNKVFGLGVKKIGEFGKEYHITIRRNNVNYQICDSETNYKIEVLKTEEIISEDYHQTFLKVWFRIDTIRLNDCNPGITYNLDRGLVIAQFMGYKS